MNIILFKRETILKKQSYILSKISNRALQALPQEGRWRSPLDLAYRIYDGAVVASGAGAGAAVAMAGSDLISVLRTSTRLRG